MSVGYKQAYAKLGEERVQVVDKEKLVDNRTPIEIKRDNRMGRLNTPVEQFWSSRVDQNWSKTPGYFWKIKRTKEKKFMSLVPRILVQLEPTNTFNPLEAWESELSRQTKELNEQLNPGASNIETNSVNKKLKKEDIIKQANTEKNTLKRLIAEVTRIRNSKKNLMDILKEIKIPEARAILIVQILRKAYDDYQKTQEKKLLYETMWAIENSPNSLPTTKAPQPLDNKTILVKDSTLVYDDVNDVEKLLKKCRKIMQAESDMIRLQLVDMSDSLPPLTKFNFGLRLDPWQKRVLAWIDAGKSVVICAPTSSGKTVLSSYVAIIFKSHITLDTENIENDKNKLGNSNATTNNNGLKSSNGRGNEKNPVLPPWEEEGEEGGGSDEEHSEDDGEEFQDGGDFEEDEEEEEEEEEQHPTDPTTTSGGDNMEEDPKTLSKRLVHQDFMNRKKFFDEKIRLANSGGIAENTTIRVLFVVPTEPLVWQVAAYFTKLLREEGDQDTKVGIVTDHLTYYPPKKFDVMPQIVVGTPFALETALTKPRGLVGKFETNKRAQGDLLPGGFDHFDWAIYDEVHALDGAEGAALQRLIRSMNCKFLALSATVGNAEELRGWMERARGDNILGLEAIDVTEEEVGTTGTTTTSEIEKDLTSKATLKSAPTGTGSTFKVRIVKTLTQESRSITLNSEDTLQTLKETIAITWPELFDPVTQQVPHTRNLLQMIWKGIDLFEDTINGVPRGSSRSLRSFGLFQDLSTEKEDEEEIIYIRSFVNMLTHHGRFINLQRYVWNQPSNTNTGILQTASPLLAVESVESLQSGVLDNSSLSFTSRDSYRLWDEIKRIYPSNASILQQLSPYNFFRTNERITLQRTKDYEDLLKSGLKKLAEEYPVETQELLHSFQLPDPAKEFDLCELVLELKARDMLPCLPFHLNTFEAVRLFQNLLAGIEWRQKRDHPTYYMEQKLEKDARRKEMEAKVKSTGKNDKALDEAAKAGDIDLDQNFEVDEYLPHPNYTFTKGMPMSELELTTLIDDMEKNDGFAKRDANAMNNLKGKNQSILKHALIRGLRRGIGLFIDEVSFPSYRRAVQRLASTGKLAVVISDDSLAFGVNMPFRTCVFCGEMFGLLDELMAQQMSGRAGRRGLDTQGNLVYAGMRVSRIRRLMIGTVSNITGKDHNPRYASLILQPILAPRHVGWHRAEVIGGRTLYEHVSNTPMPVAHYTMDESVQAMTDLGFITINEHGKYGPNTENGVTMAMLSVIWCLRDRMHESASVGVVFPEIMAQCFDMVRDISLNEKKLTNEKMEAATFKFFVILVQFINRTSYESALNTARKQTTITSTSTTINTSTSSTTTGPTSTTGAPTPIDESTTDMSQGAVRLQDLQYFALPAHREFLNQWADLFKRTQTVEISDRWASLRDPVGPEVDIDGTFMQCILDRRCVHQLSDLRKQEIKAQLWHAGNVLRTFRNCCWPEEGYNRVAFVIFRTAFEKIKYLNSELIRGKIDFEDISSLEREKRVDADAVIPRSLEAQLWSDNAEQENASLPSNSWTTAIDRCVKRIQQSTPEEISDKSRRPVTAAYHALSETDMTLINALAAWNVKDTKHLNIVATGCVRNAYAGKQPELAIGVMMWVCKYKAVLPRFVMYLKTSYDDDLVTEEAVRAWFAAAATPEVVLAHVPQDDQVVITVADVVAMRKSAEMFLQWLDKQAEESEEESSGSEEEEED